MAEIRRAIRIRVSQGLRAMSYAVRDPRQVCELLQLKKQEIEQGLVSTPPDTQRFDEVMEGSDVDIREFVQDQIAAIDKALREYDDEAQQ